MNETTLKECDTTGNTPNKKESTPLNDITNVKEKISGIYKIINKVNGKYYVGSSTNLGFNLKSIKTSERLKHNNIKGFYWNALGKEPIVPHVQKN